MSLYDDASLALLTGAGAGKDGKLYVAKPAAEFGDELITNGGFDTDTDWTLTGSASISGGVANFGASGDYLITNDTPIPLSVKQYRIEYEVVSGNAGALRFAGGSSAFPTTTIPSTVGTHIVYVTSNGTQSRLQFNSVGFIGSIDNVSVKEVLVNADFEFTRGSNLAATRVGPTGLIEKGRENILTYSNTFDNAVWTWNGGSATGGQTDRDGGSDAYLVTRSSGGALIGSQSITMSGVYTFSVYVKINASNGIGLAFGGTSQIAHFNISDANQTAAGYTAGLIDATQEYVGNNFYRLSITGDTTATQVRFYLSNAAGTTSNLGGGSQIIQDAQLEQGLVATDYIESGASTGLAGVLENEPRFDYSGSATCPSLLLEPQRGQLIPYTEYLDGLGWNGYPSADPVTNTPNYAIAPDGTKTASLLGNFTSSGFNIVNNSNYRTSTLANQNPLDDTYTMSVWLKTTSGTGTISLLNRAFTSAGNSPQSLQCNVTNEWQRFDLSNTYTAAEGASSLGFVIIKNTTDTLEEVLVWGAQMEQGSYPTSYIPNHSGGSVTRNQDYASGVDGVGDDIGKGTWLIDIKRVPGEANQSLYLSPKENNAQQIRLHFDLNGVMRFRDALNGYATIGAGINTTDRAKLLVKVDTDGGIAKVFINGEQIGDTYVLGAVPFEFGKIIIESRHYNLYSTVFFPEALTDVECIKLTEL